MNAISRIICRLLGHRSRQRRELLLVPGVELFYPSRCTRCGSLTEAVAGDE